MHTNVNHNHQNNSTKQNMTLEEFLAEWHSPSPTLLVHTSGSTGSPKPMLVEKRRMEASARITCDFLGLKRGDTALLCMPLDYIAGKMVVVRSLVCGLQLVNVKPSGHPLRDLRESPVFAAMVPMQVYNSMQVESERRLLSGIQHLIIGGGAVSDELALQLRDFPNAVWSTYGMTETLSHIALRRLNGPQASCWYEPFESVDISTNADGCLVINAPLVCADILTTNDIVEINPDGRRFRIHGRKDNVICSGGIKLQIEEIEAKLQPYIHTPFMITKRKDEKFGETVVMLTTTDETTNIEKICHEVLSKYEQPHVYITVKEIPMTATGKPARAEAAQKAEQRKKQTEV